MSSVGQQAKKKATTSLLISVLSYSMCLSPILIGLYLGGTNLRVCLVTVQGDGKFEITQSKYRLTEEQKQGDGQKLLDFCAECLKIFIDSSLTDPLNMYLGTGGKIPLGFTVSTFIFCSSCKGFLRHQ